MIVLLKEKDGKEDDPIAELGNFMNAILQRREDGLLQIPYVLSQYTISGMHLIYLRPLQFIYISYISKGNLARGEEAGVVCRLSKCRHSSASVGTGHSSLRAGPGVVRPPS